MSDESQVIFLRGIPGSGKSTTARMLVDLCIEEGEFTPVIVSADNFFMKDGVYKFDRTKLRQAHDSCFADFKDYLSRGGYLVIVDNTNIKLKDMDRYYDCIDVDSTEIAEMEVELNKIKQAKLDPEFRKQFVDLCFSRNVHGVPRETIERMLMDYEFYPNNENVEHTTLTLTSDTVAEYSS